MTKDKAFQEYEEELDKISQEFYRAKEKAKDTLNTNLKAIRAIQQKKGRYGIRSTVRPKSECREVKERR